MEFGDLFLATDITLKTDTPCIQKNGEDFECEPLGQKDYMGESLNLYIVKNFFAAFTSGES